MMSSLTSFTGQYRLQREHCLFAIIALSCLLLCIPFNASGMGLDSGGKAKPKCVPVFRLETFKVAKVRSKTITYEFRGHMEHKPSSNLIACPPPTSSGATVVLADWNYTNRVAAEAAGYYESGEFHSDTTSLNKCDDDPWLNAQIKCERIGSAAPKPAWPEPRPFTVNLTQQQRVELIKQVESQTAPAIVVPAKDQVIKDDKVLIQAKVYLPTATLDNSEVEITIEVKENIWPSPTGPVPMKKIVTAPVVARHALINIPLKHGIFQVRARLSKPATQLWSKPVNFKLTP